MKVIHLISGGDTGGAKTHIHNLLAELNRHIDVTLVCFFGGDFSREAEALGIPTVVLEGGILSSVAKVKELIRSGDYDLIHSHGARGNFIAAIIKHSMGLPVISTIHSDPKLDYLGRPLAQLVYGSLNTLSIRRMDYLTGVSGAMRDLLISRGFRPNRIFEIYNGLNFSVPLKKIDRAAYFAEYGFKLEKDCVVVGIAARLDPVKDVGTLIRGFALAQEEVPQLRLAIAGDGLQLRELKALAEQLQVADKVCFMGWLTDMDSFYGAIDINVLSSLSETFPYALTEGARASLPTVSTRIGGVPALIEEGETGFLFQPGDARALCKKLSLLARDGELRLRLGQAIYEKARREFSVESMARRQINIYSEILRREKAKKTGGRRGVIISGAYGMGNAGDDAILGAIVTQLRSVDPLIPITALSRDPRQTEVRFGIDCIHSFNLPAFRREMKNTRLYISGGGSLIQNVTSRRSLWYYLHTIRTAKKLGNRVMMYGCGIGPVYGKADIKTTARTLNSCVDVITLREELSKKELIRFGVTSPEIIVSADPAFSIVPASSDLVDKLMEENGLDPQGRYVCFSVRDWPGFSGRTAAIAAAADYCGDKLGAIPVFVHINRFYDADATAQVRRRMKTPGLLVEELKDPALTIGFMSRMSAVVSMRLHGLIFASSTGTPVVGISYDPKVSAFLNFVGDDLCLPVEEVTAERLCPMLEKAVSGGNDIAHRRQTVERIKAAEKQNIAQAAKLLEI